MKTTLTIATLACAATFTTQAEVRINGFANLIGGITSSDDTFFGYDEDFSINQESSFAVQISGDINERMMATGQIVARGVDDYDAELVWGYISFQATDNISVSGGRLRLPLFRYSDSLDVGYSYHWLTPPQSVYDVPFNNLDGFRIDYSNYVGDWEYNIQFGAGEYESDINGTTVGANNVLLLSGELTYDWFKLRAVAGRGNTTFDTASTALAPALAGLAQISPSLADLLDVNDDTGTFLGLGVEVDKFDWFVSAEITEVDTEDSLSPKDTAYYVTGGLRLGAFTPSITYETRDGNEDVKFLDRVASLPAELQPTAATLIATLQVPFMEEYDITTLGIRYDYDTNIAVKADISRLNDDLNEENDATLLRVGVSYVF